MRGAWPPCRMISYSCATTGACAAAMPAPRELPLLLVTPSNTHEQRRRAAPAEHVAAALGERARDGHADAGRHAGDDHHAVGVDDDAQAGPRLVVVLRALPARQQPVLLLLRWGSPACSGTQRLDSPSLQDQEECVSKVCVGTGQASQLTLTDEFYCACRPCTCFPTKGSVRQTGMRDTGCFQAAADSESVLTRGLVICISAPLHILAGDIRRTLQCRTPLRYQRACH